MARQSVSKHLAVLEAANLVVTVRRGREKLHYLNPAPINEIAERWINHYHRERIRALSDLKRALEDSPMGTRRVRVHDPPSPPPPSSSGGGSPTRSSPGATGAWPSSPIGRSGRRSPGRLEQGGSGGSS